PPNATPKRREPLRVYQIPQRRRPNPDPQIPLIVGAGEEEENPPRPAPPPNPATPPRPPRNDVEGLRAHVERLVGVLREVELQSSAKEEQIQALRDRVGRMERVIPLCCGDEGPEALGGGGAKDEDEEEEEEEGAAARLCRLMEEDPAFRRGRLRWLRQEQARLMGLMGGAGGGNGPQPPPRRPTRFVPPQDCKLRFPFKSNPQHRLAWAGGGGDEEVQRPPQAQHHRPPQHGSPPFPAAPSPRRRSPARRRRRSLDGGRGGGGGGARPVFLCGGEHGGDSGYIASEGFPRHYPPHSNCTWSIT
ncbi:kinesin-like protein KIF1C, partial [Phasianus colchicus]|uniref:kinesin-like protein KIF1C n=1 Tax=Phasianus colchicus TaxID=9054 RepID=UPI00129DEBD7